VKLDALVKRYFPFILAGLIAAAAYFQASGISQLLGGTIAPEAATARAASAHPRRPGISVRDEHATSAAAVLSRNPFDSVTGPLDGRSSAPPESDATPSEDGDPYDAPACDAGRVVLIVASENPDWSFASIEASGQTHLYRRGGEVAGKTVEHIGWDRVWLTSGGARCQLDMRSKANQPTPKAPAVPATTKRPRSPSAVPPEIASRIQKVSDTEFNVERSAVDMILEQQATLMRSARILPVNRDGKVVGVKLQRVTKGSLLENLGMKTGDVLSSINGFEVSDPQRALEAYARLRTADRLSVAMERGGKPMTIDINIR
jgi:general secretion pathway protein C